MDSNVFAQAFLKTVDKTALEGCTISDVNLVAKAQY